MAVWAVGGLGGWRFGRLAVWAVGGLGGVRFGGCFTVGGLQKPLKFPFIRLRNVGPLVYIINYRVSVQIFLGSERVSYCDCLITRRRKPSRT